MKHTLFFSCLLVLPVCFAQEKSAGPNQKIEMTFSLSPQEMFRTWCAPCHGVEGKGDGPAASALKKSPTDLTQLAKKNGGKFPAERVRSYIEGTQESKVQAHGTREMPVWGKVFSQIDESPGAITYRLFSLSSYIQGLQAK